MKLINLKLHLSDRLNTKMPLAKKINSHWFWLFTILIIYSIYDYFEHISRENQIFMEYPLRWAGFTFASVFTLFAISYLTSIVIQKTRLHEFPSSVLGVSLGVIAHLTISGPLWDYLFWFDELYFDQILTPTAVFACMYSIFRLIYFLISQINLTKLSHQ